MKAKLEISHPFPWIAAALGLAAITAVFFMLQFSTSAICCGDLDGYYHIHWSQLLGQGIRHGHFTPAFSWLPLTTLNPHSYADQHFFFHLLLVPFLWFAGPVSAAKISAALFGTLAVFSCFWLVLRYRILFWLFWLLALLGSSSFFLYRMNMTRAQSISLVFIIAGVVLLFGEKYRWLAAVAFLYVWTYNLFVVLAMMALLWTVALWWTEGRREWRPLLWTAMGIAAGSILNPYFPHNLRLLGEHITAKTGELSIPSGTGMEWYALSSWELLASAIVAFAAMLAGYIAFGFLLGRRGRAGLGRPVFFMLFSTLLLLAAARSRRFIEYWPPCAVLFAAFTLQVVWIPPATNASAAKAKSKNPAQAGPAWTPGKLQGALLLLVLTVGAVYQVHHARLLIQASPNLDQYHAGAEWLSHNTPRGTIIFNASWDDFPKLFYYDDANTYVSGLDPIYLEDQNPEMGPLYERIAAGKESHPGEAIHGRFGADYVFMSASANHNFYVAAMLSGEFTKVYEDKECMVLKVRSINLLE